MSAERCGGAENRHPSWVLSSQPELHTAKQGLLIYAIILYLERKNKAYFSFLEIPY
jgi:hypothetical protein